MSVIQELGSSINQRTKSNLIQALDRVHQSNNLCVIPRSLSSLLNYLAPFLELKKAGNFDKTAWLDTLAESSDPLLLISAADGLIVLVDGVLDSMEALATFWPKVQAQNIKTTFVVKDLSRSVHLRIAQLVTGSDTLAQFEATSNIDVSLPVIRLSPYCRISTWKTLPICIDNFVFSIDMPLGGLLSYLENPMPQISQLSDSLVDLIDVSSDLDLLKFKNAFANGDHASLLLNVVLNDKLPLYLATNYSPSERYCYENQISGNTDLVVIERNNDYFPLLLDHLNYQGILDDVFGTKDELNNVLETGQLLNDDLYNSLKDLNFGSIGVKLNKLARYIQLQFENSGKTSDLKEIKQLVQNLGDLSSKQELVRKHTALSELVLDALKNDKSADTKYDLRERWLALQNDIFDLDYKQQMFKLYSLLDQKASLDIAATLVMVISIINDGLKPKDLEAVEAAIHQCYGLEGILVMRRARDMKLLKVNNKSTDFFGAFTFGGKTEIETTTTSTASPSTKKNVLEKETAYDNIDLLGVTGGQDVYKSTYTLISKFWNLHPMEEEGEQDPVIETVADYPHPSFAFASATVPLTTRLVEALYFRDFFKYKPVNKTTPRPNWDLLNLDTMIQGQTVDKNLCDTRTSFLSPMTMDLRPEFVVVVFIGGITRGEISVLRYLQSKLEKLNKHLLVLTSGLVNNRKLMTVLRA